MKNIFFLTILFLTFLTNAQTKITKNLGDYSTLKVYNGIEVVLIKSENQKLEITGEKSKKVKVKNVNGTLKLSLPFSLKPSNNSADGKILIKLYYNKNIHLLDANEGATITSKDFNQNKVEVNAQEGAFINLTSTVNYLKVRASSGGIIKLSGATKNQEINVNLYAIYHGFHMKCAGNSTVVAGTGSKAEIAAGETLNAKVNFGGSIFYKGNPEVIKNKKVIGGVIEKRN
ncbi:MAG: head GIN domain-containing protein [Polaribacter sp.]